MHASPYEQASELARQGRFADGLQALSAAEARHESLALQTLRAELLEQTGAYEDAQRTAQRIRRSRQADASLASRCEVVIGEVALVNGHLDEARARYQTAASQAIAAGDGEQLCRARLRLLYTTRTRFGEPAARLLLSDLRRNATRAGNPHITAALHLCVGAIEAERGALDVAIRHISVAQSILSESPNALLNAEAEIGWTAFHYTRNDFRQAHVHAERALHWAGTSGAALQKAAALGNLGHILLSEGRYREARAHIEQALSLSAHGGFLETGLTDGLARACLLDGSLDQCDRLVSRLEELVASCQEPLPYSHRWSQPTLMRAALERGRRDEAIRLGAKAVEMARQVSDPFLEALMLGFWAELLSPADALKRDELLAGAFVLRDGSVEIFSELERVLGQAFAQAGLPQVAASHFERSIATFNVTGHLAGRDRAKKEYRSLIPEQPSRRGQSPFEGPVERGALMESAVIEKVAASAAALNSLSASPDLFGAEAMALLQTSGCAAGGSLVCTAGSGERQIVEQWGIDVQAITGSTHSAAGGLAIDLGGNHKGAFRLLARAKNDLTSLITLLNIRSLIVAALELERSRVEHRRLAALWPIEEQEIPAEDLPGVFAGAKIRELIDLVRRTAAMHINVLVTGETGTGKELMARLIHQWSPRAPRPFIPFNCSAVPRDMLDGQLFGHRRGAFTGAFESFQGVIRAANGGTLFLDEIGEVAIDLQPKLLRFLESGEVHPIGEARPTGVDVRIIAATNADLNQLVEDKRFREDLLYRLNVLQIRMPPLRERRDEIPLLATHFLARHASELEKADVSLSAEALEFLSLREWPGNIRELSNTIRRAVALARPGATLMPGHLESSRRISGRAADDGDGNGHAEIGVALDQPLPAAFEQVERAMIGHAIRRTGGQMEEAARLLGLSRKGLYLKRQRLGLEI